MQSSEQPTLDLRIILNLKGPLTEANESLLDKVRRIGIARCEAEGKPVEGNVEATNHHCYVGFLAAVDVLGNSHIHRLSTIRLTVLDECPGQTISFCPGLI
jgi:hypothetical protein